MKPWNPAHWLHVINTHPRKKKQVTTACYPHHHHRWVQQQSTWSHRVWNKITQWTDISQLLSFMWMLYFTTLPSPLFKQCYRYIFVPSILVPVLSVFITVGPSLFGLSNMSPYPLHPTVKTPSLLVLLGTIMISKDINSLVLLHIWITVNRALERNS